MNKTIRGRKLTSREAARVLGVSEASVKRWADSGLLPMEKTAGGHRRFRPEDVAIVQRAGLMDEEAARPLRKRAAAKLFARPTVKTKLAPGTEDALVAETFRALLDGRDEDLSALLVNLHLDGHTVAGIADSFLCAAMSRVGDLWHEGELSVAQEHVATRTATSALQRLEAVIDVPAEKKFFALCCSVEEDFHELPVQLAALTLEAGGLEVFNLGMNTPFFAMTETVERFRPSLVCVSSTILFNPDRAAREYGEFYKKAQRTRTSIVLGGAGFADAAVRNRLPADLYAESFRQLEEFVRTLVASESSTKKEG